jgi:hypothetical protein
MNQRMAYSVLFHGFLIQISWDRPQHVEKIKHWHQIWVPKGTGFNDICSFHVFLCIFPFFLHLWAIVMDPMFRFRHILHSNFTISRLGRLMRPMRTSTSSWAMPGLRQWVDFQETLWDTHGFHMSSPFYKRKLYTQRLFPVSLEMRFWDRGLQRYQVQVWCSTLNEVRWP